MTAAIRWSDNDRYFGPFTYAPADYNRLAVVLGSGDGDDYPGCRLRLSAFRRTLIIALPAIIKPWRQKVYPGTVWDAATVARLGRDWYYDTHEREYGFSYSDGFLQVFLGRQTQGLVEGWHHRVQHRHASRRTARGGVTPILR